MSSRGFIEAALSTDSKEGICSFSLWNINTSTQLVSFKGLKGSPNPKCVRFLDNNHFVTVIDNVLYTWSIFVRKCLDQKLFLPGKASTLCSSPCGNYLVCGIADAIYIWQLKSGYLLSHLKRHSQTISALKMNHDGSFLISGGEDGMVLVWPFADILAGTHHVGSMNLDKSRQDVGVNEPRFTWQHHNDRVTDIYLTNGERCLSSSTDRTVNLYSYIGGQRLACFTMPTPIWSIVMDRNETLIYLGGEDGKIYSLMTSSISLSLVNSSRKEEKSDQGPQFFGHIGKVTSLSLSMDGTKLISASEDSSCKVWSIDGRKMLLDMKHQAPLANLTTLLVPDSLALSSMAQTIPTIPIVLRPLRRDLYKLPRESSIQTSDLFEEGCTPITYVRNEKRTQRVEGSLNFGYPSVTSLVKKVHSHPSPDKPSARIEEVSQLKKQIKELYLIAAKQIFKDSAHASLKPYSSLVESLAPNGTEKTGTLKTEPKRKRLKRATHSADN